MTRKYLASVAIAIMGLGQVTAAEAAIDKPQNIEFSRITPTDVAKDEASSVVSWDPVAGANAYGLEANADGEDAIYGSVSDCAASCIFTLSGLTGGVSYSIEVIAYNSNVDPVESAVSDPISHTPHSAPAAPETSSATADDDGITLTWSAPTLEDAGGVEITGYVVSDGENITQNVDADATTTTLSSVTQGQSYSFTIRATNRYGQSPASNFTAVTAASAPSAPRAPVLSVSDDSITATWSAPTDTGSGEITAYRIDLLRNGSLFGQTQEVGPTILSLEFDGLSAGDYRARVRALNSVGSSTSSPLSNQITIASNETTGGGGGGGAAGTAPEVLNEPTVFGTNSVGNALTSTPGTWDLNGLTFSFQWYRCDGELESPTQLQVLLDCDVVQGATSSSYAVTELDRDKYMLAGVIAVFESVSVTAFTNTIAPGETIEGEAPSEETDETPSAAATSTGFWTKRNGNNVKIYAKNIIGLGKVQFYVNSQEIAWIRAEDLDDPKLRVITEGPMTGASYLVRDKDLRPGKNVFEIYLNGERVERRVASLN